MTHEDFVNANLSKLKLLNVEAITSKTYGMRWEDS